MIAIKTQKQILAFAVPTLIFISCFLITLTAKFKAHSTPVSIGILLDVLLVAPLACYFILRKNNLKVYLPLRLVILSGIFITTLLLSKTNSSAFEFVKTWVFPLIEFLFIGFIIFKFYTANKLVKGLQQQKTDFLMYCRAFFKSVLGNRKAANMIASEVSVFYYAFCKKDKSLDPKLTFTSYKETGVLLIFGCFLFVLVVETVGMHFLFMLWSKTAAIILTSLSLYTCLQLFAHMRSLATRPTLINEQYILFRNGILGGDVKISLDNIEKIEINNKPFSGSDAVKLSFTKNLEGHNLAVYLKDPVTVMKAFGIEKIAKIIFVQIDNPENFIEIFQSYRQISKISE